MSTATSRAVEVCFSSTSEDHGEFWIVRAVMVAMLGKALRYLELHTVLFSAISTNYRLQHVCVCVCVCSIMAMHLVGMGCYDAPAMYTLRRYACSSLEANHKTCSSDA
ncbi:hypothetical protein BU23DRAFT_116853 [Bimuria novae-zelandiae CBS 107.79]|uniref:Uncharacterized protein n=1 Tax=Bimuria novae-zelandiae CBS 107.79 TaxID=1447943 RepID=A0A6A5VH86_9PLEO|nr:hypothetical protein BU23DRAFT_116853 [Bimuria novae-zelandiae CBS 107.79]